MSERKRQLGFTLIELLLVIAIVGVITSFAMVGQRRRQALQRDVTRVSHMTELQKALALYLSDAGGYPTMTGCISGTDDVTEALMSKTLIGAGDVLKDPLNPENPDSCYYYAGTGSAYTLRYTLEKTSSSGEEGDHLIVP